MPRLWGDRRVPTRIKMQASSPQEEKQIQEKQSRHCPKQQLGSVFWHKHWPWQWSKDSFFGWGREKETRESSWWGLCWLHWTWWRYRSPWRCEHFRWHTADGIGLRKSQDTGWQSWRDNQAPSDHENCKSLSSLIGYSCSVRVRGTCSAWRGWRGLNADCSFYFLKTNLDGPVSFCLVEGLILFILYMS